MGTLGSSRPSRSRSLIGVFAVLYLLNYSANTVDLFAIVLAITLVADDAIVVVERDA